MEQVEDVAEVQAGARHHADRQETPNVISAKYPLEWDEDNPPNKNVAGVPFDVIESEWFDSYA